MFPCIFLARNITRSQAAEIHPLNTPNGAKNLGCWFLWRNFAYLADHGKFLLSILGSLRHKFKTRALDALSEAERAELIASLEESEQNIAEGRTYNGDQLRQVVRSWLGK